jgi:hypothetical protein
MKNRERFDPLAIVSKITKQEKELLGTTFIAPYIGGGKIRLRLDGIVFELQVRNCPEGWSIFEIVAPGQAAFAQAAPLSMLQNYLKLFPRLRLILVDRFDDCWWAVAASNADQKIRLGGPVPIFLNSNAAAFDTVYCRFDGSNFWYEAVDRRRDPAIALALRQAINKDIAPDDLYCAGMVPQEKLAYQMRYLDRHKEEKSLLMNDEQRIANALNHAGAQLDSYRYSPDREQVAVRFIVGGREHQVSIRPNNLELVSAGICLSGRDSDFDLASLVGVLREAEDEYFF